MRALRSTNLLRIWLLVLTLLLGQAAMLAHGAEHLDGGESPHVCRLCLAGQNVDGPVPPATAPVFLLPETFETFSAGELPEGRSATLAHCRARGPPLA